MAAATAGQAVDAGACRVGLTTVAHGLAVGQIQTRKLCGFERINVAWQFIAILATTVLATLSPTGWATALWARAACWWTPLAVTTVVKTCVTLCIATTAALAFKAGATLWTVAA